MNNRKTTLRNTKFRSTKLFVGISALGALFTLAGNSFAQSDYDYVGDDRNYDDRGALVTIYEHCDFRGSSQVVDIGDYRSMRELRFGNDRMSSIKVPRGTEVTIYEDDNFRGAYARIDRDIRCFDRNWNDKVSSLRVDSDRYADRSDNSRYNDRGSRNRNGGDYRNNDRNGNRYGRNNNQNDRRGDDSVTAKNVSKVVFGSSVLQQLNRNQWQLNNPRSGVSQYKETSRDSNSVYLQNDYTAQRVRIDLFANDVTFINRNGKTQRYNIERKQAALAAARPQTNSRPAPTTSNQGQNRRIRSDCFNFRAYTRGGNGGLRFQGKGDFYRFDKKAKSDRVCHKGSLTMEINKTDPSTDVVVEIDGNRYRFAPNESADEVKNNWHRKYVRLKVGR